MDALIKEAVKEEMERQRNSSSSFSQTSRTGSGATSSSGGALPFPRRTTTRLSTLLERVRGNNVARKRKRGKEHRLQIRWLHYDRTRREFVAVKHKNGGGKRYIPFTDDEPLTLEEVKNKGAAVFFPNGRNGFAGDLEQMIVHVCDATESAVFEFPGEGTVNDYLTVSGLYPSSTYFYIRTQDIADVATEFDEIDGDLGDDKVDEHAKHDNNSAESEEQNKSSTNRIVCDVCSCTFVEGDSCIRCMQNAEYATSLAADSFRSADQCQVETSPNELGDVRESRPSLQELRNSRLQALGLENSRSEQQQAGNFVANSFFFSLFDL